ncbi:unnamed protein product [Didymodactylos carnosus]|uniref:G-protein coupled receptors family 1 profile domain-containing protein n=1 Tax=Didymodactylos carnosus TaxID=1234261 RepID=A0A813P7Y0_9BILA|nr:unnamed protein product [Didymodactylos carnosus]CAF0748755.1 unnamed protein product [Didymodactylos carnosus]CAF3507496.1 unnamed protein product [Didymodactylos carnosus]CAF3527973.1 unnamed protein product [Didymodactylos carnosus]
MRRSLTNRLIVHVACCDLIILLFNIPDIIQFVSTRGNWVLNRASCKLIRSILVLAQYASVLTMCAVTIERFIGIVYPLRSKFLREKKHVAFIMIGVWLFSFCCCAPNLIYLDIIHYPNSTRSSCSLQFTTTNITYNITTTNITSSSHIPYIIYKSIESCIFYFIPLLLQLYCYTKIARRLFNVDEHLQGNFSLTAHTKQSNKLLQLKRNEAQDDDDDDDTIDCEKDQQHTKMTKMTLLNNDCQSHSSDHSLKRHLSHRSFVSSSPTSENNLFQKTTNNLYHRNSNSTNLHYFKNSYTIAVNALRGRRNVIKMLIIVIIIYFISFSPQVFVFLLFDTGLIKTPFIPSSYFIACTFLLVYVSSASNPIVYVIFCSKFRTSFQKILQRLFICRIKTTSSSMTTTNHTCCGCFYFQRGNNMVTMSGTSHSPSTIYHFHTHDSNNTMTNDEGRRAFASRTVYKCVRNG